LTVDPAATRVPVVNVSVVLLLGLAALLAWSAERFRRQEPRGPTYWATVIALAAVLVILAATALGLALDFWLSEPRRLKLMA
jgi:hypothetical protein